MAKFSELKALRDSTRLARVSALNVVAADQAKLSDDLATASAADVAATSADQAFTDAVASVSDGVFDLAGMTVYLVIAGTLHELHPLDLGSETPTPGPSPSDPAAGPPAAPKA